MTSWTKEQLEAINKDNTNIIVSAGAGSGKTAVLSERVLRKLKQGVKINELLVLTFTNAAAKEMKERIRKKIKEDASLKSQLDLVDSSYITTFDSYSLSIVKKYYYLLNINKDIKISDSDITRLKKEEYLNDIFEKKYKNKDENFIKMISDFTTKDDENIRQSIIKISDQLDLLTNKGDYLNNYIDMYYSDNTINKNITKLISIIERKRDILENLLYDFSFTVEKEFYDKFSKELNYLLNSKNYDEYKENSNVKLVRLPNNSSEEAKNLKNAISGIIQEINSLCDYEDTNYLISSVIKTKDYVSEIIDIIKELDEKINDFKTTNNIYEFNDISNLSIKLLKENKDVRDEIKYSFNEIMIDEYQDTNDIQEEFISYISNNNVYMVGDIKQSIYRFRNANPYIFKNKYDNYSNNINGYKIDLNKNFRSREEVLNNINDIFNMIMDDYIGGAHYSKTHNMIFGNTSYNEEGKTNQNNDFEIFNYNYDKELGFSKEEYEAFIIANDINNKVKNKYQIYDKDEMIKRDCSYNDFVILMDRTSSFDLYKKIFEYLNIPLSILKDESIKEEKILLIIKNIIRLIIKIKKKENDVDFKHLFMSILRSPIYEYNDEKIFDIITNDLIKQEDLFIRLSDISNNIDSYTINILLDRIISEFNFYENIIKIGNVDSNFAIIDYVKNLGDSFSSIGYTVYDFADYLETVIDKDYDIKFNSPKNESNSVRIMTIHKSKGLEFSICYYPGLYKDFNLQDLKERFFYNKEMGIITPIFDEGIRDIFYKNIIKENYYLEEISEKIRLFYVALTRAKEKMIMVCDLNDENDNKKNKDGLIDNNVRLRYRSFLDILLSIKNYITDNITNIEVDNLTKNYDKIKKINFKEKINLTDERINVEKINIEKIIEEEKSYSKNEIKLFNKDEIKYMKLGTELHNIFEMSDLKNYNNENEYVSIFLKQDLVKDIKNANIFKEYEFMYEKDNILFHGIIDLLLEYDDKILIIDYKLKNVSDENYLKQLNGYKEFIESKTKKKTYIYLYSILDNIFIDLNN